MEEDLDGYACRVWSIVTRIIQRYRNPGMSFNEDHGLTPQQLFTLEELVRSGPLNMKQLSASLAVTQGVATRMVDRLLEKDMVERRRDRHDRRVVMVSPSPEGREVIRGLMDTGLDAIKDIFREVPPRDRGEFLRLLELIAGQQAEGSLSPDQCHTGRKE